MRSSFPAGAVLGLLLTACSTALPDGVVGPDADRLARKMEMAVNAEAWRRTGAVTWVFAGRNRHLWDRERNFDRVISKDSVVLVDNGNKRGRAWEAGVELTGDAAKAAVESAWASWINDSFWLNPVVKAFDSGVVRKLVPDPENGHHQLLVQYTSGGKTPGDAYLWRLDDEGLPTAWRMWTSVLPIDGIELSWERWLELETGARVSTLHSLSFFDLELTDVHAAKDLRTLEPGEDPFVPLLECDRSPERCSAW